MRSDSVRGRAEPSDPRPRPTARPPAVLALVAGMALAAAPMATTPAVAQGAGERPAAEGHWEGEIAVPGSPLSVVVDLARGPDGWSGEVDIPAQGARDLALSRIRIEGDSVAFSLSGVPGQPAFRGTATPGDSATIRGDFTQSGQSFPFSLSRTGPPELDAAAAETDAQADTAVESEADPLAGFGAFVEQALEDFDVPGATVAVVRGDSVALAKGWGVRNVESGEPVTARTVMPIGSATKAFTSLLVGTLVEEGELAWDEPVRRWLPTFRLSTDLATDRATPVDLLTHRTGLPRHDLLWYGSPFTRDELFDRLRHLETSAEFRTTFQYNNLMYMTAGLLAGEVAGSSWEELVRSRILEPLGMDRTTVTVGGLRSAEQAATGYREASRPDSVEPTGDPELAAMDYREIDAMGPAGSVNSTVLDMARWIRLHLNEGVVDGARIAEAATVRRTHRPEIVVEGGVLSALLKQPEMPYLMYGLGWFVQPYRGHRMIHHGGNIDGFSARVSFLPDEDAGVVVLTNRNATSLPTVLTLRVFDRLLGLEPIDWSSRYRQLQERVESAQRAGGELREIHRKEGTSPTHALDAYAGSYRHPGYGTLEVRRGEEGLTARYHGIEMPLEHWHYDAWRGAVREPFDLEFLFQFETNRRGDVAAVTVPLEPQVDPVRFEKVPPASMSDPAFLRKLTGRYRLMGLTVTVERRDGSLSLTVPGQPPYRLEPYRGTEFDLRGQPGYSVRFRLEDGRAAELVMIQPNGVFTAGRIEEEGTSDDDGKNGDGGG